MVTYSAFPVTVDGVRLDSAAWNVEAKTRSLAAVRNGDTVLPGADGVAQSLNDDFEPASMVLTMWVLGTDADGIVPGGTNAIAQCRANLDALVFLFGKRHALLTVSEVVDAAGSTRRFAGKVIDTVVPEVLAGGRAKFTVALQVGSGMWEDESFTDYATTGITSGVGIDIPFLAGTTGPVSDGIFLVPGPATNPQLNDVTTGAYCRLNLALPAGQAWRVNSDTWTSRYGAGLTLASTDAAGTAADAITVYGGGSARMLRLVPQLSGGVRRVAVSVTGTSFTGATGLSVRARRKFLF